MEKVCTGDCCYRFPVAQMTWAELQQFALEHPNSPGIQQIAKMVIPKERVRLVDTGKEFDLFQCRNWDPITKLCKIYETRPRMCSEYPYERVCGICGLVGDQCVDIVNVTATAVLPGMTLKVKGTWLEEYRSNLVSAAHEPEVCQVLEL